MEYTEQDLVIFRPTESNRKILKSNAELNGMTENELINYFIENNSSKHRPIIEGHEETIKSQFEDMEAYQEEIEELNGDIANLQTKLEESQSKIKFLNKENTSVIENVRKNYYTDIQRLCATIDAYETDLLDECFEMVEGRKAIFDGEEIELLTKADLVKSLVKQYHIHLKELEAQIEDDEEDEENED